MVDNLSAHTTAEMRKWLAHSERRRWPLHFAPMSSSWLNLIERRFQELTTDRYSVPSPSVADFGEPSRPGGALEHRAKPFIG